MAEELKGMTIQVRAGGQYIVDPPETKAKTPKKAEAPTTAPGDESGIKD